MPSDAARETEEEFTSERAAWVMTVACRSAGFDSDGARLIRLGENALFRLAAHPIVVRIARSTDYLPSVRKEVAVSRWLADEGFPAARTVDDLEQPVVVADHPVTFWYLIEGGDRKPTYGELGDLLRELHAMRLPADLQLPSYDAFGRTDLRVEKATGIPEDDREFLRKRGRELRDRLAELRFTSPRGPVHGDAHVQNLMVDSSGRALLIDFEGFSHDHPEWDLMVTATEHHSLGWQTPEQYAAFVGAYGRDLRDWELCHLVDDVTLCVSELVGNAVHHATPDGWQDGLSGERRISVAFRAWPKWLFVEVCDQDSTPPMLPVGDRWPPPSRPT